METITIESLILALLTAMSIPSAVMGLLMWRLQKRIEARDARNEERQRDIEKMILFTAQNSRATYTVAEATAKAVQRIPDAHCNGDMTEALQRAKKLQMEEQQFLIDQGVKRIFGNE